MKVGILGTGDVGRSLANGFIALGHEVKMGSREVENEKAAAWVSTSGINASTGTFEDAAKFGDVIVTALNWAGAENAIRMAGPDNFAGKVVIDPINPLKFDGGKLVGLEVGTTDSAGERMQKWLPKAKVVKAFNIVGHNLMFQPDLPGGPPTMFICGNDAGAKETVTAILKDFGWPTIDIGGIEGARYLEPLCPLWVGYAFATGTFTHAFKLLKK